MRVDRGWLVAGAAVVAVAVASRGWVAEDAFISFRTVSNALDGYGLTWNVDERVQVYTHPLWLLLHLVLVAVTGEYFLTTIAVGVLCTAAAYVFAARAADGRPLVALAMAGALVSSRAFVDFGTSGLESSLTYLLLALFAAELQGEARPLRLSLWTGLLLTNRMDTVLFVAPALALALRRRPDLRALALGLSPFVAWELFSLFYYGFFFPNTSYAKLSTGIAPSALVEQGLIYVADFVRHDPAGAALSLGAVGAGGLGLSRHARAWLRGEPAPLLPALGLGVGLYTLYTVRVGGDFMTGRFLAPGVLVAVVVAAAAVPRRGEAAAALGAVLLAVVFPRERSGPDDKQAGSGIADERVAYLETNSLERWVRGGGPASHRFSREGLTAKLEGEKAKAAGHTFVVQTFVVGMMGFHAGPDVIIVDGGALTDALLARIPMEDPGKWRVGHYGRYVPRGYLTFRSTGDLGELDPDLRQYLEPLRRVISGPLFSGERLSTILAFQTGAYDEHLEAYQARRVAGHSPTVLQVEAAPIQSGGAVVYGAVSDGAAGAASEAPAAGSPDVGTPAAGAPAGVDPAGAGASAAPPVQGAAVPLSSLATPRAVNTPPNAPGLVQIPVGGSVRLVASPPVSGKVLEVSADGNDVYRLRFFRGDAALGEVEVPRDATKGPGLSTRTVPLPDGVAGQAVDRVEVSGAGDAVLCLGHVLLK